MPSVRSPHPESFRTFGGDLTVRLHSCEYPSRSDSVSRTEPQRLEGFRGKAPQNTTFLDPRSVTRDTRSLEQPSASAASSCRGEGDGCTRIRDLSPLSPLVSSRRGIPFSTRDRRIPGACRSHCVSLAWGSAAVVEDGCRSGDACNLRGPRSSCSSGSIFPVGCCCARDPRCGNPFAADTRPANPERWRGDSGDSDEELVDVVAESVNHMVAGHPLREVHAGGIPKEGLEAFRANHENHTGESCTARWLDAVEGPRP